MKKAILSMVILSVLLFASVCPAGADLLPPGGWMYPGRKTTPVPRQQVYQTPVPARQYQPRKNQSDYFRSIDLNYYTYAGSDRVFLQIVLQDVKTSFTVQDVSVSWTDSVIPYEASRQSANNTMYLIEREKDGTMKVNIFLPTRSFPRGREETVRFRAGWENITVYFEPSNEGYWHFNGTPYFESSK